MGGMHRCGGMMIDGVMNDTLMSLSHLVLMPLYVKLSVGVKARSTKASPTSPDNTLNKKASQQ